MCVCLIIEGVFAVEEHTPRSSLELTEYSGFKFDAFYLLKPLALMVSGHLCCKERLLKEALIVQPLLAHKHSLSIEF